MMNRREAYEKAEIVDAEIEKVLAENPICYDNKFEWLTYLRTIQTTLNILELKVMDIKKH